MILTRDRKIRLYSLQTTVYPEHFFGTRLFQRTDQLTIFELKSLVYYSHHFSFLRDGKPRARDFSSEDLKQTIKT